MTRTGELLEVLDLKGGWWLLTDADGTPYVRAPNGEKGEVVAGDAPSPGWVDLILAQLQYELLPDERIALAEAFWRWGGVGGCGL